MANILVIDDDRTIVKLVSFLLTREGHAVSAAFDGQSGLKMALDGHPNLIILDVMMPGLDGFSVSGALFKDPEKRKIPILVLTAKGASRDIFNLVPNVMRQMDKPFEPKTLVQAIRDLLTPQ